LQTRRYVREHARRSQYRRVLTHWRAKMYLSSRFSPHLKRRASGFSTVEVGLAAFLMICFAAFTADLTILNLAFYINDQCCRDCARAAGGVPTNTQNNGVQQTQAQAAALAWYAATNQLTIHKTDGFFISQPVLVGNVTMNSQLTPWSYCPQGWPPAQVTSIGNGSNSVTANTCPTVTVTTQVTVKLPVYVPFFNGAFNSNKPFTMSRTYVYPVVTTALTN
jgi:hypothetical protein